MMRLVGRGMLLVLVAVTSSHLHGQSSATPSSADYQRGAQNLMKANQGWGPSANTPNVSISLKEQSRSGAAINFRMHEDGLPKDKVYSVVNWPVTQAQPTLMMQGVTFDPSGFAVCAGTPGTCTGDKPNDPIDFVTQPVAGEPVRLAVVSDDHQVRAYANIVPIPLRDEDHGCTVEAILLTPDAALLWIEASGFPPDSEVKLDGNSEGEAHSGSIRTDANGKKIFSVEPFKAGLDHGTLHLKLVSPNCAPIVAVPWGKRS